jgi:hypothetical protein
MEIKNNNVACDCLPFGHLDATNQGMQYNLAKPVPLIFKKQLLDIFYCRHTSLFVFPFHLTVNDTYGAQSYHHSVS